MSAAVAVEPTTIAFIWAMVVELGGEEAAVPLTPSSIGLTAITPPSTLFPITRLCIVIFNNKWVLWKDFND